MKTLDQYYEKGRSLADVTRALVDPRLSLETDKDSVDSLVMNLAIKYAAKYFGVVDDDPHAVKEVALKALEKTDEDVAMLMARASMAVDHGLSSIDENDDVMASESLADLRATAVVVREVIFNDRFDKGCDFVGVDFGSGSSILMLASMISALRAGMKNILVVGFDISKKAIEKARACLSGVVPDSFWRVDQADILDPNVVKIFDGLPLGCWISETFSHNTPRMEVKGDKLAVFENRDFRDLKKSLVLNQHLDPFPQILTNTAMVREGFFRDVREEKTAMFPDIVNGKYVPDLGNSVLSFRAGSGLYMPLSLAGNEFREFEDFGETSRWPEGGDFTPEEIEAGVGAIERIREIVSKHLKGDV